MYIIDKLSAGNTKIWYKAGTLAKVDPGPGDVKCEFSKTGNKFRLYKFSEGSQWEKKIDLPFKVTHDMEAIGSSKFSLIIGKNEASYQFKQEVGKEYLHLKLKEWEYAIVFV